MENIVFGFFGSLGGIILLFFNKRFASFYIEFQNKLWGLQLGDRHIRVNRFVCVIVGSGFLIVGVLALVNIIHFK